MYFTIRHGYYDHNLGKYQENSEKEKEKAENIINEFSEIKLIDNSSNQPYDIYYIDITDSRKLKLQSLQDDIVKRKLIKLETILYNEKLICLSKERPGSSGTSGSTGISGNPIESIIEEFKREYFS